MDPLYPRLINNYYGCMGGGPVMTGIVTTEDACYRPAPPGGSVTQFKNGLIGVNARDPVTGKIKYTKSFKDCLDGSSNVVLAGESAYQGIEILRGWFNGYRTNAGGASANCPAGNIAGTAGRINGGRAHYLANTNRMNNQNIHNALNTIYFGSEHKGGCHLAYADGSAHFFSENISLPLYQRLGDMKDGRPPGGFTP
jgi:prepilin-type processing-associated H-X9-DG protein